MTAVIEAVLVDLDTLTSADIGAFTTRSEADKAAGYRSVLAARRFLARRAAMRLIVACRLGQRPQDVGLSNDGLGRPLVANGEIHVSQSARAQTMLAVTCIEREVGCDIEALSSDVDVEAVARLCFALAERKALRAALPEERLRTFYDCWTRKEAFLKAIGTGFAIEMSSFETSRLVGEASREGQLDWASCTWTPVSGYLAAVVARGTDWRLVHGDFAPLLDARFSA